jgi:hypothetical protein
MDVALKPAVDVPAEPVTGVAALALIAPAKADA